MASTTVKQKVRAVKKDMAQKVIHFADYNQDFLRWGLDANGKVLWSEPFQSSVWSGFKVLDHESLKAGDHVWISRRGTTNMMIKYPLTEVQEVSNG